MVTYLQFRASKFEKLTVVILFVAHNRPNEVLDMQNGFLPVSGTSKVNESTSGVFFDARRGSILHYHDDAVGSSRLQVEEYAQMLYTLNTA